MPEQKADIMNNKGLTIEIGRENQYVVEDITKEKIDSSFFASQYRESLAVIESYLKQLPETNGNSSKGNVDEDYANNIIAFVGDRGSGKTSCMESVAEFLSNSKKDVTDYKTITSTKFYALDLIDPAFFDDEHNIVSLVVATLYRRFTENDKDLHNPNHDDNIKLYHQFAKVQNELEWILDKSPKDVDELDKLTNLSNTVSLKHDMLKLVNLFLKYMGKEDGILLLHIDDIDLNTQCADKMMESIRKYLILPNILILMSAKVEQLENVKQLAYVKEYQHLLKDDAKTGFTHEDVKEMVDKFIVKFLPHVQRIHMPEIEYGYEGSLSIKDNDKDMHTYDNWKDAVPELIYTRMKLPFLNKENRNSTNSSKQQLNKIIPYNLRELCQLIRLLHSMDITKESYNIALFYNYLISEWVEHHLRVQMIEAIRKIDAEHNLFNFNKTVLTQLCKVYSVTIKEWNNIKDTDNRLEEALNIINIYNYPENISLGDVFGVISILEEVHNESVDQNFFFLIRAIYTRLLTKTWQDFAISEQTNNDTLSSYEILVGGNYINSNIIETMAPEGATRIKRSVRRVKLEKIREKIKELYAQTSLNEEQLRTLHFIEIVALCTSRRYDSKYLTYSKLFRKNRENKNAYSRDLTKIKKAFFDVNSFMFNILHVEAAYTRISDDLLALVKNTKESLYNAIENISDKKHGFVKDSDTLLHIVDNLRNYYSGDSGNLNHLYYFFERLSIDVDSSYVESDHVKSSLNIEKFQVLGSEEVLGKLKEIRDYNGKEDLFEEYIEDNIDKKRPIIETNKIERLKGREGKIPNNEILLSILKSHPFIDSDTDTLKSLLLMFPQGGSCTKKEAKDKLTEYNLGVFFQNILE